MNIDVGFYWKLFLRRLPAMALLFLICSGIGIAVAIKSPTAYTTNARLVVQAPQIDPALVQSSVQISPREQIETIRLEMMTRANMLEIANKHQVFEDMREMNPNTVVSRMRSATRVRASGNPTRVRVAFTARNPQIAQNVVNEYVTFILSKNTEFRGSRSEETVQFFEEEERRLNRLIAQQRAAIATFERENYTTLPENMEFRLNRQRGLQQRIEQVQRSKASLTEQRQRLVAIFQETGRLPEVGEANLSPQERRLRNLQRELDNALLVYSPANPRIRVLQTRVAQLEAEVSAAQASSGEITPATLFEMQTQQIDEQIAALDEEIVQLNEELELVADRIAATPATGIELREMRRILSGFEKEASDNQNALVRARRADSIEQTARGQRIVLVDPPTLPNAPSSPNRPLIASMGVGAGLGLAAALFLLLELINRSVRRPAEIVSRLGITPLATIPYVETRLHRKMRYGVHAVLVLIVLIGTPAALWAVDSYYMPLEVLVERVMSQLGLA